ncbi:MAG: hypothetical protein ABTQ28_16950 [Thauera sp.]|jgi:hypothetical protein
MAAAPAIAAGTLKAGSASGTGALPALEGFLPALDALDHATQLALFEAGVEVLECRRVLIRGGLNVVGEILRGQDAFVEMAHYPPDDVFDADSHAQYYYHAHRGAAEHGHFHTFLRAGGMPDGVAPAQAVQASEPWPEGDEAISHLIAVSMDAWGEPIGLFACNRWVSGETWYAAEDVIRMLDRFEIDHAWPSWPANRWLGAMLRLYRPWIEGLLRHRDAVVSAWLHAHPGTDVFEDRALETTGYLPVSVPALMTALEAALGGVRLDWQGTPERSDE